MKIQGLLIAAILFGLLLSVPSVAAEAPEVLAQSAILMDADTGRVLFEQNADEPRLIASTTKIMTALIALERLDMDRTVVIEPAWAAVEGSTMYLEAGREMTVRELLYGLMLASGNDAAVALACIAAGSVEAFADLMNERAGALGCGNTHFENPNGLDSENHYSSARDLAKIAREAIQNEAFCRIVSTPSVTIGERTFTNHNRLLRECEGVFGVKTGYTEAAGRTLVTCCEREGITLICVTLSDPDDWRDHAALYDWAYGEYTLEDVSAIVGRRSLPVIGGEKDSVSVSPAAPLSVLRRAGEEITASLRLPDFVYASVQAGDEAGSASVYLDGEEIGTVKLVFDGEVEKSEPVRKTLRAWFGGIFRFGERKIYTLS